MSPATSTLLLRQAGVATVRQLVDADLPRGFVRAQVEASRWQSIGYRCIVTHNHVLSRRQLLWVAVLDPEGPTALAGMTPLELAGFKYFGRETELIHIVVVRGARHHRFPGVKVHESRRFGPEDILGLEGLRSTSLTRSAIDAAAWQPFPRYATGLLAAAVQQRICTCPALEAELSFVGRVRHKQHMRLALLDIAGGAEALSEIDVARMCRTYALAEPHRQSIRRDGHGRKRYLDCEWFLDDGRIVVLEVDGSHHVAVGQWEADMKRERGVVVSGRHVLRASAYEARYEQAALVADLRAIGIPQARVVRR
jgi:hypothetical protein